MSNVIRILCDKELKGHNEDCELRWYRVQTSLDLKGVFYFFIGGYYVRSFRSRKEMAQVLG